MDIVICAALLVLAFGLVSARAGRSPITAPMVFVTAGVLVGPGVLDIVEVSINSEVVQLLAEITLVLILFVDASTISLKALRSEYTIPARLLGIGLPLTMALGLLAAWLLFPDVNPWLLAVMAFILSPTDAALGQAVITSKQIPVPVRDSITVESGLNDGIALPPIMACIAALGAAGSHSDPSYWVSYAAKQIAFGPVAGAAVGAVGGILIDRAVRKGWMEPVFQRLASLALALLCYAVAERLGGNGFIAAFFGGLLLGTRTEAVRERIQEFGEAEGQQLSLFVFLLFGIVLVPEAAKYWDAAAFGYAILSLTVIRMLPVALSLCGARLGASTVAFIGWFGPRGIASVLYLLIFFSHLGTKGHERILAVIVLTVLLSIFLHGLSAVPLSTLYGRHAVENKPAPA